MPLFQIVQAIFPSYTAPASNTKYDVLIGSS